MTLAETVRDIRHRLAELVAERGGWNSLVDYEANWLITQALEERDIDVILSAPDDVILADFRARGDDIEQYAAEMRQRFDVIARLTAELAAAHQRECIVVEAYERQQQAQRELEALYTVMTERAQAAEADMLVLRQALMDIEKMGVTSGYSKAACAIVARRALAETERKHL
jgi:uncharacterized protein YqeY